MEQWRKGWRAQVSYVFKVIWIPRSQCLVTCQDQSGPRPEWEARNTYFVTCFVKNAVKVNRIKVQKWWTKFWGVSGVQVAGIGVGAPDPNKICPLQCLFAHFTLNN